MGKRSDFERINNDLYPTPLKGVLPLLPLLKAERFRTFAVPCGEPNSILVQTLEISRVRMRLRWRQAHRPRRPGTHQLQRLRENHHQPAA